MPFTETKISRREFLLAWVALGVPVVAGGPLVWYANNVEPGWLDIVRVRIPLSRLPRALNGLTIAQLSDLHFGPFVSPERVRAAVETVLKLRPDIAVVTGDFATSLDDGEANFITRELSRLTAPLGAYAVLGNHDHWTNKAVVIWAIRRAGLKLLQNTFATIKQGDGAIYLVGVDDIWEGRANLSLALRGVPDDGCAVLLAHEPDFADEVSKDRRVALQLSGHSHGGQVRIPGLPRVLPRYGRKYPDGLRRVGDMYVYTNRGIGVIRPPVRFNCRPEVTLVELVASGG